MARITNPKLVHILPKFHPVTLTFGLDHASEFACRCGRETCTFTIVSLELLKAYTKVREGIGAPLTINSAYRCQAHNAFHKVKGSPTSSHTTGHAIDISFNVLGVDIKGKLLELATAHFDYVQVYPTFIHCHMLTEKNG